VSWLKRLALLLAILLGPSFAFAAFEDIGAGARAPGMGNAFTAVADDAYAIYYNPAGLMDLRAPEFSAAYSKLFVGLSDSSNLGQSTLAFATPLKNGAWGKLGLGWQRFSLDGMYSENTITASYAPSRPLDLNLGLPLMWGVNLKYLQRGFSPGPEASNSCNNGVCGQGPDPVLMGPNSASALDADLGMMLRVSNRYTAGLMLEHVLHPDVGFSGSEVVGRALRLGFGYHALWTNLSADLHFDPAPDGSTDKTFIVAAERFYPTLLRGEWGVRGSLGLGTREVRQLTLGGSYRIGAIQADYAFLLPVGGIASTLGTHRFALSYHFGAPPPEEEFGRRLLTALQNAPKPTNETAGTFKFQGLEALLRSHPALAAVIRSDLEHGEFARAYGYLRDMADEGDPALAKLRERLSIVAAVAPALRNPSSKWERELAAGIGAFLDFQDPTAVRHAAYAYSLHPSEPALGTLNAFEAVTHLRGDRVSPEFAGKLSLVEDKIVRMTVLLQTGKAAEALTLGKQALELEPTDPTALSRVGTAYFLLGQTEQAVAYWTQALQFERSPSERDILVRAIRQTQEKRKPEAKPAAPTPPPAPVVIIQAPKPRTPADPREIERLYREGVELYAAGDTAQAAEVFRRILDLDPGNDQALKALKRLKIEQ
jgi:tetratricopeptide (TPR) repeat protein